jgi:hypothetical protein
MSIKNTGLPLWQAGAFTYFADMSGLAPVIGCRDPPGSLSYLPAAPDTASWKAAFSCNDLLFVVFSYIIYDIAR